MTLARLVAPIRGPILKPALAAARRVVMALGLSGLAAAAAQSAPTAAFVVDVRDGTVYHAEDADRPLHPASLTKMMTLYLAFEAFERRGVDPDARATVSANAAGEGGSSLGLRAGQTISLRHLVRAVAVRSANDASTALAEALAGSEAAFVERMNARAADLGMTRTRFRNAHGLTAEGHLSTARDMSRLGRHLWFDYPAYWDLFSRRTADAGVAQVAHTNRRFLNAYSGADGIKTGYTSAAGFNLTASAARGDKRLIVTVFGAPNSATRAARVARLMDEGFARAPETAPIRPPTGPAGAPAPPALMAATRGGTAQPAGRAARGWLAPAAHPLVGAGPVPRPPDDRGIGRVEAAPARRAPSLGGLALTAFGG